MAVNFVLARTSQLMGTRRITRSSSYPGLSPPLSKIGLLLENIKLNSVNDIGEELGDLIPQNSNFQNSILIKFPFSMVMRAIQNPERWMAALMLDPETGLDPPGIKIRAAQGIDAAQKFIEGYWLW